MTKGVPESTTGSGFGHIDRESLPPQDQQPGQECAEGHRDHHQT